MKAVLGILGFIAVIGAVYALALFGVIPTQQIAAKSPAAAKILAELHLGKKVVKKGLPATAPIAAAPSQQKMLDAEKQQLDAERTQLDQDKAAFEAQQKQAPTAPQPLSAAPQPDTDKKLIGIYNSMDSDTLALIFAKLPDPQVVQALMQMHKKQAGEVFASLPPGRAARISEIMDSHPSSHSATVAAMTQPAASL